MPKTVAQSPSSYVAAYADVLEAAMPIDEALGELSGESARVLRKLGGIRNLQPAEFGGYETTMRETLETTMRIAALNPAAAWVNGVVGVHPWEIAQANSRLQTDIWGDDTGVWVASQYHPGGRARRVEGGWQLSGHWQFSSGTDHCEWTVLGGFFLDDDGALDATAGPQHFFLPRADYTIVPDSWNIAGLRGTGSKDILVEGAFVPDYRILSANALNDGLYAEENRPESPLYALPFGTVFSYAVAATSIGIAEGALESFMSYTRNRVTVHGTRSATDPVVLSAIGAAAADVHSSRLQLLDGADRMFDVVISGRRLTLEERLELRRNQVRTVRRSVEAVDQVVRYAGGGSFRDDQPLQRYWRDAHVASSHVVNVADRIYEAWGRTHLGLELDSQVFA